MEFLAGYEAIFSCTTPLSVSGAQTSGYDLTALLNKVATFKNLEIFKCSWGGNWAQIPHEILKLPKLKELIFSKNQLYQIPAEIVYAEQLTYLDLSGNTIAAIPAHIGQLTKLQELDLSKNPIDTIDEGILELRELRSLNLQSATFTQFPEALLALIPQLSELWLNRKMCSELKKKHPQLYRNLPYLSQHNALESKYMNKSLTALRERKESWELRAFLLNLLGNNPEKIEAQASEEKLLNACNFKLVEPVRLRALEVLSMRFGKDGKEALANKARLAVQGKLGINKNELRQKLKDHHIQYAAKIDDKTTHVLVGQSPGETPFIALEKGLFLLTEKNITAYWEEVENPYLLETVTAAPEQGDGLAAMLLSGQEDSILVALAMFKQGGFPKELITELFIAFKMLNQGSAPMREAERLLRQYGSAELVAKLKMVSSLFFYFSGEASCVSGINKYCSNTELDGLKFAKYIYKKQGGAVSYLLRHLPKEELIPFLKENLLKDGVIDLSKKDLRSFPAILFKLGNELQTLKLSDNSIGKIPENIKSLTALKELDLRGNYALQKQREALKLELKTWLPNCKVWL